VTKAALCIGSGRSDLGNHHHGQNAHYTSGKKNLDYYRRRLTSAAPGRHRRREQRRLGPAHSFALETTVAKREKKEVEMAFFS
jgi:hypothetical protein